MSDEWCCLRRVGSVGVWCRLRLDDGLCAVDGGVVGSDLR
jgi:hypothetical protein